MTVTVRPFPKRTYQNGIRPFRPVVPANNIRPYTLKTWRPPVPEPLRPAPLLGPKELLGLGLLVLAQLWGRLASKPKASVAPGGLSAVNLSGLVGAGGGQVWIRLKGKRRLHSCNVTASTKCFGDEIDIPESLNFRKDYGPNGGGLTVATTPGTDCGVQTVEVTANSGGLVFFPGVDIQGNGSQNCGDITSWSVDIEYRNPVGATSLPSFPRTPDVTLPNGFTQPVVVPAPAVMPVRPIPSAPPAPAPAPVPEPEVNPFVVPITPGPAAPPATAPQVPRRTVPLPLPGATPTQDGAVVPQRPAPVPTTPPDAHFPVPGAPPVTGNGPRPTPEGIAQELGRLEQKLARLSDPGPEGPGDGSDRLQLISDLIGRLIEFATSMTAGGGYSLSSPCELDENGNRIVSTVNYAGATNSIGVLSNKIDALAGVLQVHKDLKQPNCKQAPAVGQPVTVNFVQVD